MDIFNILLFVAMSFWTISLLLLLTIQYGMISKYGAFSASLKKLNDSQIKRAKTSGYLFLFGALNLLVGFVLRDAL